MRKNLFKKISAVMLSASLTFSVLYAPLASPDEAEPASEPKVESTAPQTQPAETIVETQPAAQEETQPVPQEASQEDSAAQASETASQESTSPQTDAAAQNQNGTADQNQTDTAARNSTDTAAQNPSNALETPSESASSGTAGATETNSEVLTESESSSEAGTEKKLISEFEASLTGEQKNAFNLESIHVKSKDGSAIFPEDSKLVLNTVSENDRKAILSDTQLSSDEKLSVRMIDLDLTDGEGKKADLGGKAVIVTITYNNFDTQNADLSTLKYYRFDNGNGPWAGTVLADTASAGDGHYNDVTVGPADENGIAKLTVELETDSFPKFALTWDTEDGLVSELDARVSEDQKAAFNIGSVHVRARDDADILPEGTRVVFSAVEESDRTAILDATGLSSDAHLNSSFMNISLQDAEGNAVDLNGRNVFLTLTISSFNIADVDTDSLTFHHFTAEGSAWTDHVIAASTLGQGDGEYNDVTVGDVDEEGNAPLTVEFETGSFSPFALTWNTDLSADSEGTLVAENNDVTVTITYSEEAGIPDDAEAVVRTLTKDDPEYEAYRSKVKTQADGIVDYLNLYDIAIVKDGVEIEPKDDSSVSVTITQKNTQAVPSDESMRVLHIEDSESGTVSDVQADINLQDGSAEGADISSSPILDTPGTATDGSGAVKTFSEVSFNTDSFSVFSVYGTVETVKITDDGSSFGFTVTYDKDADIPANARLEVAELGPESAAYQECYSKVIGIIKEDGSTDDEELAARALVYSKFFDITLHVDADGEDKTIEPDTDVQVDVDCKGAIRVGEDQLLNVIHFPSGSDTVEFLNQKNAGDEVSSLNYTQGSFSEIGVVVTDSISKLLAEKEEKENQEA